MNRPTIDVDDLLELADEAVSAGDQAQAVAILRKASAIAPLRRDIKNRLAIVLEGTPVAVKPVARARPVEELIISDEESMDHDFSHHVDQGNAGLDSISQIARKAFDAAAMQKAKAGDATRKLTNLLQTGIGNWKSSLGSATGPLPSKPQETHVVREAMSQSAVFTPEEELKKYLERAAADDAAVELDMDELEGGTGQGGSQNRVTKPASTSKKAVKGPPSSKSSAKRPTDVEDVLAAGIGGFLEALGRMNKVKLVYTGVYVGLIGLFGFACFDVARKFPELTNSNNQQVNSASIGASLDIQSSMSSAEALEKAQALVKAGSHDEAIALLEAQLVEGRLLHNRDLFRAELASLLNLRAESFLKENQLQLSVEAYRKALTHLPGDARLQLRLANALYYHGVMGTSSDASRKESLNEASAILDSLLNGDAQNIQAHRLQALLYEAQNKGSLARSSWQKVKTMAPAGSSILDEAKTHLK